MTQQFGRFQLLKKIATGGMAEIHIVKQRGMGGFEKLVVIKKLLEKLTANRQFVQMFLNEAKIAARLSHPNVVQIYDLGFADGNFFIAMEYIQGENLRAMFKVCRREKTAVPLEHILKIASQICEGLHHAHTKTDVFGNPLNIVHCDVSPQNIIVSYEGVVKIVDFGIAKAATLYEDTMPGHVKGKLAYMSPEQCKGEPVDARSDIFSLGIVLWELVTGRRLYSLATPAEIVGAITTRASPPPRQLNPGLPGDIDAIINRCLQKNPEDRFSSALEINRRLEDFIQSQGITSSAFDIGSFMQQLFQDKLGVLRRIEEAQVLGESMESILFDDIKFEQSEVYGDASPIDGKEPSVTPTPTPAAPPTAAAERSSKSTFWLVAIVVILGCALGYFFFPHIIRFLESVFGG